MARFGLIALLMVVSGPAFAMDGPGLPATAKKLSKDEIVSMMHGKTFKYESYNHDELKTGTTKFDFKKMKYSSTYTDKGKIKDYKNQPLSVNSKSYCYDKQCPEGRAIYADGSTIYEVDDRGKVGEVLTK